MTTTTATGSFYDTEAEAVDGLVAAPAGSAIFPCLVDANNGDLMSTKLFTLPNTIVGYGVVKRWLIAHPRYSTRWVTDFKRQEEFLRRGLRRKFVVLPAATGPIHPLDGGYGPSGEHTFPDWQKANITV